MTDYWLKKLNFDLQEAGGKGLFLANLQPCCD